MHPAAAELLVANQRAVRARAGGRCEACGAEVPPEIVPVSPIDGLPTVAQMIVLCPPCAAVHLPALASAPTIRELEARIAALRRG